MDEIKYIFKIIIYSSDQHQVLSLKHEFEQQLSYPNKNLLWLTAIYSPHL